MGVGFYFINYYIISFRRDGLDEEKCLVLLFGAGCPQPFLTVRVLKMQSICFQPRLMEKQEARRRAAKPKIREQSPEAHPRVKRKGEELYYDEAGRQGTGWKTCTW